MDTFSYVEKLLKTNRAILKGISDTCVLSDIEGLAYWVIYKPESKTTYHIPINSKTCNWGAKYSNSKENK